MKATVIVDNVGNAELSGEWGLCIFIEYGDKNILLDAGKSNLFTDNAKGLDIDLKRVDAAVLSHAHYDHANGLEEFLRLNDHAPLYVREGCDANCYKRVFFKKYIGIPKTLLKDNPQRVVFADGDYSLFPGVDLIPHKTKGLEKIGKREKMYQKRDHFWYPDDFRHEQSLVFDTDKGLVIFNSCSHGGAANIINEVSMTYPDKKVHALIGGFHLFNKTEAEVRAFAKEIKKTGIEYICTGHCTGQRAYEILSEELGDIVHKLEVGLVMEFA